MSDRAEVLEILGAFSLAGMRAAHDETVPTGIKRQHGFERILAALLKAEIAAKQACVASKTRKHDGNYQMTLAKLPFAKELADLSFKDTSINGQLGESLATGEISDAVRREVQRQSASQR